MELAHDAFPWRPWSPQDVAVRLADVEAPWGVAAGCALQLFVGERWREHEDIEIAVPDARFEELRTAFGDLELWLPIGEGRLRPFVEPLERASHQTWLLDVPGRAWRLDVLREPSEETTWICRRDSELRMPFAELLERTADGIPFVRPDVVLLFKAARARDKDEVDFGVVAPRLGPKRRDWLREALEQVYPGHPWLERL